MEKRRRKGHKRQNQLPSGHFRVQVVYKGEDGKRHTKSFTGETKEEAEDKAEIFRNGRNPTEGTLADAVESYLTVKAGVLSPSTLRSYKSIQRTYFKSGFARKRVSEITNAEVQSWVSGISSRISPKTARNVYGLFVAAISLSYPERHFTIQMPQKKRPDSYCPSDADIRTLLASISSPELKAAVMLAAFATMRRGEICALLWSDVSPDSLNISKSMVLTPDLVWTVKPPKTFSSYRTVPIPGFLYDELAALCREPDERVIQFTPDALTNRFARAVKAAGLPHIRFHDLRHYSASILHAIGIPDQYILARGGWSSDYVMKTVYRNTIDAEARKQDEKISQYFQKVHAT